jgi:hypothetical protein
MSKKQNTLDLTQFGKQGLEGELTDEVNNLRIGSFPNESFKVCPDESLVFTGHVVTDSKGDLYLATKDVANQLGSDAKNRMLVPIKLVSGEFMILSVASPTQSNRNNSWIRSGQEAVRKGIDKFIRVSRAGEAFRVIESQKPQAEVEWLDMTLEEMIDLAFGDRLIKDMGHDVVIEKIGF